jgi:hypothetical protein
MAKYDPISVPKLLKSLKKPQPCPVCGKEFIASQERIKVCSRLCRREERDREQRERARQFREALRYKCSVCDNIFTPESFPIRRPYFCSEGCKRQRDRKGRNLVLRKYGITILDYDYMLLFQNGLCRICGKTNGDNDLVVDHCHQTGKVRGLLCDYCNSGLGFFKDNIEALRQAIAYLEGAGR